MHLVRLSLIGLASLTTYGCSSSNSDEVSVPDETVSAQGIQFDYFLDGSINGDVAEVDCVLSNGIETRCYQFEVIGEPLDHTPGPYTNAAFDDCGGHVNPNDGYHYHAATGCTESSDTQVDGHASLLGYAMDGYGIYGMLDSDGNETEGLDECRGHSDETRGYHYHAASAGENMFIGCFTGKTVAMSTGPGGGPRGAPAK